MYEADPLLCQRCKKRGQIYLYDSFLLPFAPLPRTARIIVPNLPHHVMHRGHNRHVVFAQDADYQYDLDTLWEWKQTRGCRVYAYCVMTNHVHLVVDPGQHPAR